MTAQARVWVAWAAIGGFVAVAAGAFAAHGVTDPTLKDWLRLGAQYGLLHSLAALACAALKGQGLSRVDAAAWLFLAGGTLFSGSLYLMALTGWRWLGLVTPLGGTAMLLGWLALTWAGLSRRA